jgi:spermidine synthase
MTPSALAPLTDLRTSRRFLPLLLCLFVGSGCSTLIYEIVWFQLLQLVIGSSAVSLGVLLGTFMGGMCLGSLLLPRAISADRHPLRVYALLELGIGIIGLLILFGMPYVDRVYVANVGHGLGGILLRGAVCAVCMLPPTVLMGATLPAIARWLKEPRDVSWLGFFYGGNIAGAVFGSLLAGFYLLRVHDVATAAYVAAAINGAVALIALLVACMTPHTAAAKGSKTKHAVAAPGSGWVHITIALSGFTALAAEVIWTRILSLMLGATVYTFSIILAVFLVGLGVGSSIGSLLARSSRVPSLLLGGCQLLLIAAIAWTAVMLADTLPYWPFDPKLSRSLWSTFQVDFVRCLWAILPATILWGASFPLALAAVAAPGQDTGRLVGGVYAANTAGAIAGALLTSLVLVTWLGTQNSQRVLLVIAALAALVMFLSWLWSRQATLTAGGNWEGVLLLTGAAAALFLAGAGVQLIPKVRGELVAYGRDLPVRDASDMKILYIGEGMNSTVAVSKLAGGVRQFHVCGKVEASTLPQDMRLQRMLGHLSALVHHKPRSVLIVGCGAGVTAGTFVLHPDIERIVICEIESLVPRLASKFFGAENYNVLRDPRVEVVHDDGRHFLFTTHEKFDVITSDPIHPWVKGAAALYTREYFEMCKQHLNPGGVVTQWVPLYESDNDTVKSEIATFLDVFPDGTIWGNTIEKEGYDVVLLGHTDPTRLDLDAFDERLNRRDHARVLTSLNDVGFEDPLDLLATYAGQGGDLTSWLEGAQINRDRNLRLQYLAGLGVNESLESRIYREILSHRTLPQGLFTGSKERQQLLWTLLVDNLPADVPAPELWPFDWGGP